MPRTVRDARQDDLPAILAIHNDVVRTTSAIWTDHEQTPQERLAWWQARQDAELPVLVAEVDGTVVGFGSYGPFRAYPDGYRHTVEHSVHVRADRRGEGHGGALLQALIDTAADSDVHVVVAAIDGRNTGSVRLHERFGFRRVGSMPQVGRKGDSWVDLVLMQLLLPER
jgi:L-amino acid N-acyltransferase YncA